MQVLVPTNSVAVGVASHSESWGSWQANAAYALGASITRVLGGQEYLLVVVTAGTSGGTQPTWNTTLNGDTTDGTITWQTQARPSLAYEGSGVSAAPGWDSANTSPVLTYSGTVSAPQQLLDRNALGTSFDGFVAAQVSTEAHTAFGLDVLSAILNSPNINATATSGSTAYNIKAFWADWNAAAQNLETTAGVAVSPDYLGAKSKIARGLLASVDSSNRPIFAADQGFSVTGNVEGLLATLPGGLGLYHEENLESFESTSGLVLVGSASKGLTIFESEPVVAVYPE
jgi:hypothetical protein